MSASGDDTARAHVSLGEWACLGLLYRTPSHGFAVAARLRRGQDIGRVWSLSRPLTYRAIDHLVDVGYLDVVGEEPGIAGGNRTLVAASRSGRAAFRRWVRTPVTHLRDVRSELMLKLLLAEECGIEVGPMLTVQRRLVDELAAALDDEVHSGDERDVVALWRSESSKAVQRFLDRVQAR